MLEAEALHLTLQPLCNLQGYILLTARKQRRKLLTANTPEQVATAQCMAAALSQALQHLITDLMAVLIIDFLEIVEIEQQESQLAAELARLF